MSHVIICHNHCGGEFLSAEPLEGDVACLLTAGSGDSTVRLELTAEQVEELQLALSRCLAAQGDTT